MTTIRTYDLSIGDVFRMLGRLYKVTRITNREIWYRYYSRDNNDTHSDASSFGRFCEAKVEFIEHQGKPIKGRPCENY